MNVELIDFYRPDTNRKNLFITGIPQSLQEKDIVVSVRFVRTQVKVRKKNFLEKPFFLESVVAQWLGTCHWC